MDDHQILIGHASQYGATWPLVLGIQDRLRHLYIIGQTGVGKSTLLRNLLVQDFEAVRGCAFLDPHGMLARELLDLIPPHRRHDVVYIDPRDSRKAIGLNVLRPRGSKEHPHLVASGVLSALRSVWGDSWGPRMEHVLRNVLLALIESDRGTLVSAQHLLVDRAYRGYILSHVKDPVVRHFWRHEFESYSDRFRAEVVAPIQNKLGALISHPFLRHLLGQVKSTIDLRFMMDERRILIADLSKGVLGEDGASLLGSLLVSMFQFSVLSRGNDDGWSSPEPFHLYVDEVGSFATASFGSLLSEARKFGLSMTMAHQYMDQLSGEAVESVMGNVGSLIAFRVGPEDAKRLQVQFAPYPAETMAELDSYEALARPLIGGSPSPPFRLFCQPPQGILYGRGAELRALSATKYGRDRSRVEAKIQRLLASTGRPRPAAAARRLT